MVLEVFFAKFFACLFTLVNNALKICPAQFMFFEELFTH